MGETVLTSQYGWPSSSLPSGSGPPVLLFLVAWGAVSEAPESSMKLALLFFLNEDMSTEMAGTEEGEEREECGSQLLHHRARSPSTTRRFQPSPERVARLASRVAGLALNANSRDLSVLTL